MADSISIFISLLIFDFSLKTWKFNFKIQYCSHKHIHIHLSNKSNGIFSLQIHVKWNLRRVDTSDFTRLSYIYILISEWIHYKWLRKIVPTLTFVLAVAFSVENERKKKQNKWIKLNDCDQAKNETKLFDRRQEKTDWSSSRYSSYDWILRQYVVLLLLFIYSFQFLFANT